MATTEDSATRTDAPPAGGSAPAVATATAVLVRRAPPSPAVRARLAARAALPTLCIAVLAATLAGLLLAFGPPGVDRAAHVYQTHQFAQHGWRVWDNYWYAGRYELVNYSVLYYPLAALVGEAAVVLASVGLAAASFHRFATGLAGRRALPASLAFAAVFPTVVIAGQHPFALGSACALAAVVLLRRGNALAALVGAFAALLASPLAFLLLAIALAGAAAASPPSALRGRGPRLVGVGVILLGLGEVVVLRLFPNGGHFAFPPGDLVGLLLFAVAAVALVRGAPALRPVAGAAVAFAAAGLALFAYPSGVGGNAARVLDYVALPALLLLAAERRYRPRAMVALALVVAFAWQVGPVVRDVRGGMRTHADRAAFWQGAVAWLTAHDDPGHRVEVVATWGHWESYHLASHDIPIVRGWFRQDDFPVNEALYTGDLDAGRYRAWLRSLGVRYVVLPEEQLDYSSRAEAEVLRSPGHGGLRVVHRDATTTIFELPDATPLLTASPASALPATAGTPEVLSLERSSVVLWLPAAGRYDLRIRWSPYWRATGAPVCIAPAGGSSMTRIYAREGGAVRLAIDVTLARSTGQALGDPGPSCAYPAVGWGS